jgi:ABC-type bacteriocin/lantibiotic exporter with double-glycine peptidase domain
MNSADEGDEVFFFALAGTNLSLLFDFAFLGNRREGGRFFKSRANETAIRVVSHFLSSAARRMKLASWHTFKEIGKKGLRLLRMTKELRGLLVKVILLGVFAQGLAIAAPLFTKFLIDWAYPTRNVSLMEALILGSFGVNVASVAIKSFRSYSGMRLSARLNGLIGLLFFNHVQHLTLRFFEERRTGDIMSRFQDIGVSVNAVTGALQTLVLNGSYVLVVPVILFLFDWRLACLSLLSLPISAFITVCSGQASRPYFKQTAEAYAELRSVQIEALNNIRTVKSLALEPHVHRTVRESLNRAVSVQLHASRVGALYGLANGLVQNAGAALFTWYGWTLILSNRLTLGEFVAFTAYVGFLSAPISEIVVLLSELQQSSVSFDRMLEYLDIPAEQNPAGALAPQPIAVRLNGDIELSRVSFGYEAQRPTLTDITFSLKRGATVAVVGSSGSGKTSLLRLLGRFDAPLSGEIYIDGRALGDIPLSDLRRQTSIVWQDVGLFKGTIWENLTFGIENPSPEFVSRVVRICQLDSFVAGLPNGYHTQVAEKGETLSAGQRQRIAIARAIIRQAPIVIFDEATANIDAETERNLLHDVFGELRGQTVIFVSHRIASAALADHILVLEKGRLVESGSHSELLRRDGRYRDLYQASHVSAQSCQPFANPKVVTIPTLPNI